MRGVCEGATTDTTELEREMGTKTPPYGQGSSKNEKGARAWDGEKPEFLGIEKSRGSTRPGPFV